MLELKNINKYYNAGTVNEMCLFKDFNLSIADGEFVSVIGSNGSGKTSMLNLICGSIPVDSGTITMGEVDITKMPEYKRQRRIGRVYQHPAIGIIPEHDDSGEYGTWPTTKENPWGPAARDQQSPGSAILPRPAKDPGTRPRG